MNHELELINSIIETGDMPTALSANVSGVFEAYGDVWQFIQGYYDKYNQMPDKDKVSRSFPDFEFIKTTGSLQYYIDEAHKVVNSARLKEVLYEAAKLLKEHGPKAATDYVISNSTKLLKDTGNVKDTDLVLDADERIQKLEQQIELQASGKSTLGIASGLDPMDFEFGGFQPGDFVVLLGWTGMGKTWLARLFAVRAWLQGYRPLIISLEMNKYQEGYRFDTILNQGRTFRNSQLSHGRDIDPEEYRKWVKETFSDKQSFYLVTNEGLDAVDQNMVQAKIDQYNPDMVILDYHSLFDDADGGYNETERAKNLSKAFKRLAVRNQVPIIDVAAVTMEQGAQATRAPELHEVAWSRQLTYDADLVLTIFKEKDSHIMQIFCKKNRRGEEFAFNLAWDIDRGIINAEYDV